MDNQKPSQTNHQCWIYAVHPKYEQIAKKVKFELVGKWLIFVPLKEVDATWEIIKKAVESGLLGYCAKVSTNAKTPYDPNTKVICVYTTNYKDQKDVMAVRTALTELGFTKELVYKTDEATRKGIYGTNQEFLYRK